MKIGIHSVGLYIRTLRYLTFTQIFYQGYYRLKRIFPLRPPSVSENQYQIRSIQLAQSIPAPRSYMGGTKFLFLNREESLGIGFDWNFTKNGKLWVYNLNYFDFLHQLNLKDHEAVELLDSFCESSHQLKDGVEPYPISVRGVNWIKYFVYRGVKNSRYNALLYSHYLHLARNIEYHLLGNHLLENAFSLLFASYFFGEPTFYNRSRKLLMSELKEQVLRDGAHFELSPMYHQILLCRLLDTVNLMKNNPSEDDGLRSLLDSTSRQMLGWLKAITFSNGDIPMVNDAAFGISPGTSELLAYGKELGLDAADIVLGDSGYRMIRNARFELLLDIGKIGPDYIPGHAHSDTFSFILYQRGIPLIVDTGTSTYDKGHDRELERSTSSHNSVEVNGRNQSEVWSSFRVGRRAKVFGVRESAGTITASHDGYRNMGVTHKRTWSWSDQELRIVDELTGMHRDLQAVASLHFHPDQHPVLDEGKLLVGKTEILTEGGFNHRMESYPFANGFNVIRTAYSLKIDFAERLTMRINFK